MTPTVREQLTSRDALEVRFAEGGFPYISSFPERTERGTPYLTDPGVTLISRPDVSLMGLAPFLDGFDAELGFGDYLNDSTALSASAQLCKVAGQNCYASWGPKRSMNDQAVRYFDNLKSSGHGSVLEHANFSFHIYGVGRAFTHELVRHRAGFAYSQLSQRYVSGKVLRFVERPEFQDGGELHRLFVGRIDLAAEQYEDLASRLLSRQKDGSQILTADARTDLRKKVQQAARALLPNETEAPIVVTANARAWRHFLEMRANPHAELEIRGVAFRIYRCLVAIEPILFDDYQPVRLEDGTWAVESPYRKI